MRFESNDLIFFFNQGLCHVMPKVVELLLQVFFVHGAKTQ